MNHLIAVVKNPRPGAVKTRLHARYTPRQTAALYSGFVRDTLALAQTLPIHRRVIAYDPPGAEETVRTLCGPNWAYLPQIQRDLGARMHAALAGELERGASAAVLIGTDIPSLPPHHIQMAFDLLKTRDIVLGPSTDGGYYLIGLSHPCPELFKNIAWSTPQVLAQTIAQVRARNHTLGLVPPWFDADTPEELDILIAHADAQRLASGIDPIPHTRAALPILT